MRQHVTVLTDMEVGVSADQIGVARWTSRLVRLIGLLTVLPFRRGARMSRYSMYQSLADSFPGVDKGSQVLAISGSRPLVEALRLSEPNVTEADYPEHNLLQLEAFEDDIFSVTVTDQVLEHVRGSPIEAVRESLRVTRPGGFVIHTTCFANPVHGHPDDYWRFTAAALGWMCEEAGAEVVARGGWGNRAALVLMDLGLRFVPTPTVRWHPIHWLATRNDPRWPITTWVIARKSVEPHDDTTLIRTQA
jgi:SAM-dependent methyltransferase